MSSHSHIALRFDCTAESDLLEGFFLMHTTLEGIEERSDGTRAFYLPSEEWSKGLQKSLAEFSSENPTIMFLGEEEIADKDWNAEWEATILPERATPNLVISPSWRIEDAQKLDAKCIILIDPKMSFGTGHHETTRLCLRAIEELNVDDKRVLDLGTGTGVLAMYALMRGAKSAVGIDTDHWSIENATENRALNNISEEDFELRKGILESMARREERFDLILANLHRNLLIEHCEPLLQHSMPGAMIILSGILIYDVEDVRKAYKSSGFRFVNEYRENEWACLLFKTEVD